MRFLEKLLIILAIAVGIATISALVILIIESRKVTIAPDPSLPPCKLPQEAEGIIIRVSGKAYLYRQNSWQEVKAGDVVIKNDYLRTFNNSSLDLQIGEGLLYSLSENTLLQIGELMQTQSQVKNEAELFIGSVLAKIAKLSGTDKVRIKSGSAAFGVRGTQFILSRGPQFLLCAVSEGEVALLETVDDKQLVIIPANKQLEIDPQTAKPAKLKNLTPEYYNLFKAASAKTTLDLNLLKTDSLIRILLKVEPEDSDIYLDGHLEGKGTISKLLKADSSVLVELKRAGYQEQTFTLNIKKGENRIYDFKLELAEPLKGLERTEGLLIPLDNELNELNEELAKYKQLLKQQFEENKNLTSLINTLTVDKQKLEKANQDLLNTIKILTNKIEEARRNAANTLNILE